MVLNVELPDDVWQKLEARAAESGHSRIEDYVQSLLREDVEDVDYGSPDAVKFTSEEDLEELLLKRLEDPRPSIEVSPKFWTELRERSRRPRNDGTGE